MSGSRDNSPEPPQGFKGKGKWGQPPQNQNPNTSSGWTSKGYGKSKGKKGPRSESPNPTATPSQPEHSPPDLTPPKSEKPVGGQNPTSVKPDATQSKNVRTPSNKKEDGVCKPCRFAGRPFEHDYWTCKWWQQAMTERQNKLNQQGGEATSSSTKGRGPPPQKANH